MRMRVGSLFLAVALLAAASCSDQKKAGAPEGASASNQAGYAERYPDTLAKTRGKLSEREGKARESMGKFSAYPDELDKPDWEGVGKVYELADEAGKSQAYVDQVHEAEMVAGFFEDEKEEISKKVAGAAAYAAKQKGCDSVEAYGPASAALEKSVEKQLEERLREHNEAHRYIKMHEEPLGKQNIEKLEKQADDISYASYNVNVGVEEEKYRLQRMVDEGEDVKKTLDRIIEENKAIAADGSKPESVKKAAQGEVDAAESAKAKIEQELATTKQELEKIDDRIKALRDEYQKAFDELKNKVEEKKKSEPSNAAAAEKKT
jgi:chromosome segregation ATPase